MHTLFFNQGWMVSNCKNTKQLIIPVTSIEKMFHGQEGVKQVERLFNYPSRWHKITYFSFSNKIMISRNKSQLYAKFLCHILKVAVWHIMNGSLANLCTRTLNYTLWDTRIFYQFPNRILHILFSISDSSFDLPFCHII